VINIYDSQLNRIGVLSTWISLIWETRYNETGSLLIETHKNEKSFHLLGRGHYCTYQGEQGLMIIITRRVEGNRIIATGFSADWILSKRVSTEVISNENAEQAMRKIVSNMAPWDRLSLGTAAGLSDVYPNQFSDGSVLQYLQEIGQACDIGFRIVKNGGNLLFETYKPTANINAKYSQLYGNLGEYTFTESENDYCNVAIVAGEGEGENRITVIAGNTAAAGFDRRELYVDARQIQREEGEEDESYKARLINHGLLQIGSLAIAESVSIITKRDNVSLGDVILVNLNEFGIVAETRVTAYRIKSQHNKTERKIDTGVPVIRRKVN